MVPVPQPNRVGELMDAVRAEFDTVNQEASMFKMQRDDCEHKINAQIQEMNAFQQNLYELERTQQTIKKQYEDEINRLRAELDRVRSGHPSMPTPGGPNPAASAPPPNIGHGPSNLFGGIINNAQGGPPGLVAPTQMMDPSQQPPTQHPYGGPNGPPPQASGPGGPSTPYMNGAGGPPPGSTQAPPGQPPNVPHSSSKRIREMEGPQGSQGMYGGAGAPAQAYPYGRQNAPGTPNSQAAPLPSMDQGGPNGPAGGYQGPSPSLNEVDPDNVPSSLKTVGEDWFAIFNNKVQRSLKVDLIHTLDHQSVVCCVKFSADGKYLAAGCNRSTHIYDVQNAAKICVLEDNEAGKDGDLYIRSVCFSPDGKYLATGAEDKQIRIWDIKTKRIRHFFSGHDQDIYSLDFSRDGRIIVSGSGDRTARIWCMETLKCLYVLRIQDMEFKDPGVTSVAISPDSRFVAAGSLDKMVRVWDTTNGQLLERLEGHKDSVYSVAFMPDGKTLVSGSLDKTLKLWQLGTGSDRGMHRDGDRNKACKQTFTGHKDFVLSVATTPDGNWVVSGSKDRSVQFWDPRTGLVQFTLQGHKNSVISVAISPNGRPLFATGSGDNRARIWSYDSYV
ncbi:hypothetical protein BZG36_03146 [Bifiguratus adelaidae]|uniref:Transcriptional repressor Tup1 N-terminal domain-containing protein n=1 Tax=Bifiguratus adelaidae TaxID=1938954 RepID=A0A261XX91_9FUNG|nr:hypothetical protein BZG36_03146 [Bifiguratus adelaidae]